MAPFTFPINIFGQFTEIALKKDEIKYVYPYAPGQAKFLS